MLLKLIAIVILLFASFPGIVSAQKRQAPSKAAQKETVYSCPMHPEVTSKKPGRCPKCGMFLRAGQPETASESDAVTPKNAEPNSSFTSARIRDARISDQNGKQLNFYTDLVKGKTVAINFIFTTCTASCPPLTATFRRVQQSAAERGLDVHLISVSVDPAVDTPERLRAFASKFNAAPGWTFVTGEKSEIEALLEALGVAVSDKNDHTPMIMIGNDLVDYWTRAYGLSSPTKLTDLLAEAASRR